MGRASTSSWPRLWPRSSPPCKRQSSLPAAKPALTSRLLTSSWGAEEASDRVPAMNYHRARDCANLSHPLEPCLFSKDSAQLEEPFAVAGVADAAVDKERAEGGFGQEALGKIVGELGAGG